MSENAQTDVVVIGAGMAGLVAANRAAQLGLSALVLEQSEAERYPCNSRYAGGTMHVALSDIMLAPSELAKNIEKATQGFVRPEWVQLFAADGRRVVRWLQEEGARFLKAALWRTRPGCSRPRVGSVPGSTGRDAPATCCCATLKKT